MDLVTFKKFLDGCESPFKWEIPARDASAEHFIKSQTEKGENISEESQFKWNNFIVNLLLAYEWCDKIKNTSKAEEYIAMCMEHLKAVADCEEEFFCSIKTALWHVTLATYAQILLSAGKNEKAVSLLNKITPLNIMSSRERAGVLGIKAAVYLQYATKGHRLALKAAETAKYLDPKQAEWHFIAGNAMGRIRRTESKKVTVEEVDCILQAIRLQRDASYVLHIAALYAEQSKEMFFNAPGGRELETRAVEYFKEAIAIRPNDALLKARVAHGLIRIRSKDSFQIKYIKELLEEVVAALPNNAMVYHDLGTYYEKFENNVNKAIWNLEKSNELGNEKALLTLISLKWKNNLRQEIIKDLKMGLEKHKGVENQAELLTHLGVCYLINDDWTMGLKHLSESLKVDPSANYLMSFGGFKGSRINLLELIVNELRLKTARDNRPASQPFLELCKSIKPELFGSTPRLGFEKWKQDQLKVRAFNRR